jgi:hypothetical protein
MLDLLKTDVDGRNSRKSSMGLNKIEQQKLFNQLREKWREVPGTTQDRIYSHDLLNMADGQLLKYWDFLYENNCVGTGYSVRGWYHDLYAPLSSQRGKWLEVGSGLGFDGIFFAGQGARVTFLDIVEDNLCVIERICNLKRINNVEFKFLDDISSIAALDEFDVILAVGALINAPADLMSEERRSLGARLKIGGRWLELCYPKERWEREGAVEFSKWGRMTDGDRTPWVEWYDLGKLLNSLSPHRFDIILSINFHKNDFNWFDLKKIA